MTSSPRLLERKAFGAPRLADRYVSWARAVMIVGDNLHKDEWAGSELARAKYTILDRQAEIDAEVQKKFQTATSPKASPILRSAITGGKPMDPALLQRVKEAAEKRDAESKAYAAQIASGLPPLDEMIALNDDRKARLVEAQSKLFGAIINSQIPAFWYADGSASDPRRVPDGELVKDWNAVGGNLRRRGYIWRERAAWYVYVDASKLAECFPRGALPKDIAPDGINPADLSEYMQLALYVAGLGYGARFTGLKDEIATQLIEAAPRFGLGDGRLTEPLAKQIATILRDKEWQAGKAGAKWAEKRKG